MRLMEVLPHASAKNENRKALGFQISHFHWPFSSEIMAGKGLWVAGTNNIFLNYFKPSIHTSCVPSLYVNVWRERALYELGLAHHCH